MNVQEFIQQFDEVLMFGVTEEGDERVCVRVFDIPTFIHVAIPPDFHNADEEKLLNQLNKHLISCANSGSVRCKRTLCGCSNPKAPTSVYINREPCADARRRDINIVISSEHVMAKSFIGYEPVNRCFLKIRLLRADYVTTAKNFLSKKLLVDYDEHAGVYETTPQLVEQLMYRKNLTGFCWISLDDAQLVASSEIRCSKIFKLNYNAIQMIENKPFTPVPRCLCIDIETLAQKFTTDDPICMIACGGERKRILVLSRANDWSESGWEPIFYSTEASLLQGFVNLVLEEDPDIISGYNSNKFDIPRILKRCLHHGIPAYFSRIAHEEVFALDVQTSSNQQGYMANTLISCPGRILLDASVIVRKGIEKYRSYKLKDIAMDYDLDVLKDDVEYHEIFDLFHGSDADRARLIKYCAKDVDVTIALIEKLQMVNNLIATSQVTRLRASDVLSRGQNFAYRRAIRAMMQDEFLVPELAYEKYSEEVKGEEKQQALPAYFKKMPALVDMYKKGYEGGYVRKPVQGLHVDPVITLDFTSLYPNIMRTNNLCVTTLLKSHEHAAELGLTKDDYIETPVGFLFVKKHVREGLLPKLLENLLLSRQAVKKLEKLESDISMKRVLNAKQTALKVSANSIYGLCGAKTNTAGCMAVAASVTAFGQVYIKQVAVYVPKAFPKSEVIYGDTDSIMVKIPKCTINEARAVGVAMAKAVNEDSNIFVAPMQIAFEKIMQPYLLEGCKKYAARKFDPDPKEPPKLLMSGLESVRRDNPMYAAKSLEALLNMMLMESEGKSEQEVKNGLIAYARSRIQDLLLGNVALPLLAISQNISKPFDQYKGNIAHIKVARELNATGKYLLEPGDRVEIMFICVAGKDQRGVVLAISPKLFDPAKHAINFEYYTRYLLKPFQRALMHTLSDTQMSAFMDLDTYSMLKPSSVLISPLAKHMISRVRKTHVKRGPRKKVKTVY